MVVRRSTDHEFRLEKRNFDHKLFDFLVMDRFCISDQKMDVVITELVYQIRLNALYDIEDQIGDLRTAAGDELINAGTSQS